MKQLSLRLIAPFAVAAVIAVRFANFFTRKLSVFVTTPQRIIGKWRLYWNYCPECNSCAPKIHHCEVCNSDTKSFYNWSDDIKKTWWKRFTEKNHMAV